MSHRSIGLWLVLGAASLWGTTGTAQALGPDGISPFSVAAVRMLGGALLVGYAFLRGEHGSLRRLPPVATVIAIAALAGSQPLFFGGVDRTGVAIGTIATIGSGPLFAGVLTRIVRREPLGRRWAFATVLSVIGAFLIATGGEDAGVDGVGLGLALGAGLAWATYLVAAKTLFDDHPPVWVAGVLFSGAAVLLSPALFVADVAWIATGRGVLTVVWLALIATAFSYVGFARGLSLTPVASAATLTLAEPVVAAVLGMVLLDEPARLSTIAGILLVLAGLVVLSFQGTEAARDFRPGSGDLSP